MEIDNNIILAGDVGGTKTLLALFKYDGNHITEIKSKKYSSRDFIELEIILKDFLHNEQIIPASAVFGIPGPVENGKSKSTNLPWTIVENKLIDILKTPKVRIVNDLAATAFEIPYLKADELIEIKPGKVNNRNQRFVIVAPGTGLGQAFLLCEGNKKIVIDSEGGHVDFAPTNQLEEELYIYLSKKFERVSYERIVSGNGLINVFDFLVECGYGSFTEETFERMLVEDKAAVISDMALLEKDPLCEKTLNIFISVLGAHCGNLVITLLATGGVYLAGGIPHKILPKLQTKIFEESFSNKGRLSEIVKATPVFVLNHNSAALKGAAKMALELLNEN
ncbi:MAG: glucokinase [Ignavibacteriaceae bacterium]